MKKLTAIFSALLLTAFVSPAPVTETITYDSHRFWTSYLYESLPEEGPDYLVIDQVDGTVQEVRINWRFEVDTAFQAETVTEESVCELTASKLVTVNSQNFEIKVNDSQFIRVGDISNDLTWQSKRLTTFDGTLDYNGSSGDASFENRVTEGTIVITNPRILRAFGGNGYVVFRTNGGVEGTTYYKLPFAECVHIDASARRHAVLVDASIEIDYSAN